MVEPITYNKKRVIFICGNCGEKNVCFRLTGDKINFQLDMKQNSSINFICKKCKKVFSLTLENDVPKDIFSANEEEL